MSQLNDLRFQFYGLSGFTGALMEREFQWLQSLGATSGHISDCWLQAMEIETGNTGHRQDLFLQFLRDAGYTGHIQDMWYDWLVDRILALQQQPFIWLNAVDIVVDGSDNILSWPNSELASAGTGADLTNVFGTVRRITLFNQLAAQAVSGNDRLFSPVGEFVSSTSTMWIIAKSDRVPVAPASNDTLIDGNAGLQDIRFDATSGDIVIQTEGGTNSITQPDADTQLRLYELVRDGASSEFTVVLRSDPVTGTLGGTPWLFSTLFNLNDAAEGWLGSIGEIIIYDAVLTVPQRALVRDFLITKWNLTLVPDEATDFTGQTIDQWSVQRASIATNTGLSGILNEVANDEPYFDGANGILIEPTRTNDDQFSADGSQYVTQNGANATLVPAQDDPFGVSGFVFEFADITGPPTNGIVLNARTIAALEGDRYEPSIYFISTTVSDANFISRSESGQLFGRITIDNDELPVEWTRIDRYFEGRVESQDVPFTIPNTLRVSSAKVGAPDDLETISGFLIHSQLELGTFPTSYIRTAGAGSVSRANQMITKPPPANFTGDDFTIRMVVIPIRNSDDSPAQDTGAAILTILTLFAAGGNLVEVGFSPNSGNIIFRRDQDGGVVFFEPAGQPAFSAGDELDIRIQQEVGVGMTLWVNGNSFFTDEDNAQEAWTGDLPNTMFLGNRVSNSGSCSIKQYQFWNRIIDIA